MFCSKCGAENPEGARFCFKCGAKLGAPEDGAKSEAETSVGLSANIAGLLCYVLGWISGIVFLVVEKKSQFVKFHAWQSIMTFGILSVIQLIVKVLLPAIAVATFSPGLLAFSAVFGSIIWILMGVLWVILMIQAGTGKMWKLPWVGDWAETQASKTS